MSSPYAFHRDLERAKPYEEIIDAYFERKRHKVKIATSRQQRNGIDRIVLTEDGREFSVEYKIDISSARTGNFFIELLAFDLPNKLGWYFTSQADVFVLMSPGVGISFVSRKTLDSIVRAELDFKPRFNCTKERAKTLGLLIPVKKFKPKEVTG